LRLGIREDSFQGLHQPILVIESAEETVVTVSDQVARTVIGIGRNDWHAS
jgi:hypothetical protein